MSGYESFTPDESRLTVNGFPRTVVCAANKYHPCGTIVLGIRHYCPLMRQSVKALGVPLRDEEQGFVDQWGNFMSREEAWFVLETNERGRINKDRNGCKGTLYSKGLY